MARPRTISGTSAMIGHRSSITQNQKFRPRNFALEVPCLGAALPGIVPRRHRKSQIAVLVRSPLVHPRTGTDPAQCRATINLAEARASNHGYNLRIRQGQYARNVVLGTHIVSNRAEIWGLGQTALDAALICPYARHLNRAFGLTACGEG